MQNTNPSELQIFLTLEQSSLLLEALMEQPFKKVFEIIGQLNQQAQQFYQPGADKSRAQLFCINRGDFSLCVKALGELPYNRVSGLIQNLHSQLFASAAASAIAEEGPGVDNTCIPAETAS